MLDTDFCNRLTTRAPVRSLDSRARGFRREDRLPRFSLGPKPQWTMRETTPDHLAAIQPRVETRLTARFQLRLPRPQPALLRKEGERPGTATGRRPLAPALSAACKVGEKASDAPCRAPRPPGNPDAFEEPGPLPPSSRQRERLSRPETPSIDECPPRPARADHGEPATEIAALPPATRLPTLFRRPLLSLGKARPTIVPRAHRPRA